MAPGRLRVRMTAVAGDLRPGGTVSGPAMFALADCAFYMATLALVGREALAVTTSARHRLHAQAGAGRAGRRGAGAEARAERSRWGT